MSIASALGLDTKKIRYAVVGAGDIAQAALMPGIAHTGNSSLVAIVTGDSEKAEELADIYDLKATYSYEQFDTLLASGTIDAIYLATPNWRHAEFAIPALRAGIHVLCEKPLEVSVAKSQDILDAQRASSAKLMTAYRLHFEPATLEVIDRIRAGDIGELVAFTSCFTQMVDPANHRAANGIEAGPLFDMGPYPINAIRYLFGAEPVAVESAVATRHPTARLGDLDDTFAITLRMPNDALASFTVSYVADGVDSLTIAGTKGSITMDPAYGFGNSLEYDVSVDGKTTHHSAKETDQFGGELKYFSDCILNDRDPEPGAEEGLADLRVIEGIVRTLETGQRQVLPDFQRSRRIDTDAQAMSLNPVSPPKEINAANPTAD